MRRSSWWILAVVVSIGWLSEGWHSVVMAQDIPEAVTKTAAKLIPGMKPGRISKSPLSDLYEVVFGPTLVYMTADGKHVVKGEIIEIQSGKNLTVATKNAIRIGAINALGEDSMLVFAPKKEQVKHTISIFTDVSCPYCAKIHSEVPELVKRGIKVRYLAFPRAGIGSTVYDRMVSVWCADDPQQAMTDAKAGKSVVPKKCPNPIRDHYVMGQQVGVKGTPTIILEDGTVLPGYVPTDRLERMLQSTNIAKGG